MQGEALEVMSKHRILSVPVTNSSGIVGILDIYEIMSVSSPQSGNQRLICSILPFQRRRLAGTRMPPISLVLQEI
jgi:CBS domain-containing protein